MKTYNLIPIYIGLIVVFSFSAVLTYSRLDSLRLPAPVENSDANPRSNPKGQPQTWPGHPGV